MRFEGWELRPIERVLLVHGEPVPIGGRAFDVLFALAQRQGHVVGKSELLDAAWPGLVVEENNISVQIAALRKLLGARAISTVAGLGYRLSAVPVADHAMPRAPAAAALSPGSAAARMPPRVELLGRDADVDALAEMVVHSPLVSIIGTGGVGKTSLAKAVLARRASLDHEEHHWIDLSPLRDGAQVVGLMAKALGVDVEGSQDARADLISALAHAQMLIAVDNCEQVLHQVAAFVLHALEGAPGVRWLATSLEPLHVAGEVVYRLEPLDVPAPEATLSEALGCGALALLCRHAKAADRHFALDESNLPMAISVCRQLDGLPLAIEMAAARIGTLGLRVVHEQLGQRLRLLAGPREGPPRHHTLQSTFDWSFGLLSSAEQKVFRRLEPFVGGFGAGMAQQIARDSEDAPDALDEWQALETLSALVDKSLVRVSADGSRRYALFESARGYAADRLAEAGETTTWRSRHAHMVATWFDTARIDYDQLKDDEWVARYVPERHNVRAALAWACEAREPDLLARLVAALGQIESFVRGQSEIVQCHVPMDVLELAAPPLRAAACLEFSWAHFLDGSRKTGTELSLRALEDFRAIGDDNGTYRALGQLIRLYESRPGMLDEAKRAAGLLQQMNDRAVPLRTRLFCAVTASLQYQGTRTVLRLQELEHLAHHAGLDSLAAVCRVHITDELLIERRFDEVVEAARRFLAAGESRPRMRALLSVNEVLALVQLGRVPEAYGPAHAALRALPRANHLVIAPFALAAARAGQFVDASLMAGYCAKARRDRDERPDPAEAAAVDETLSTLNGAFTIQRLDELMRVGSMMPADDVLAIALPMLAVPAKVLPPSGRPSRSSSLGAV
jgi:predicted ATPase